VTPASCPNCFCTIEKTDYLAVLGCGHTLCIPCAKNGFLKYGFENCFSCRAPVEDMAALKGDKNNEIGSKCMNCNNSGDKQLYIRRDCDHIMCGKCIGYNLCKVCLFMNTDHRFQITNETLKIHHVFL